MISSLLFNHPLKEHYQSANDLETDLHLSAVIDVMASGDELIATKAREIMLGNKQTDIETVLFRQAILKDVINNPTVSYNLYKRS